jgi:hypothetical protein
VPGESAGEHRVAGCHRDGRLLGVDAARVRRLAIESRDDIMRRAAGRGGARIGGDWIPAAYEAAGTTE